jgi:hypothetical protein
MDFAACSIASHRDGIALEADAFFSDQENDMDLVTRRFLLGALPSTIVLAALPAWPALAANPGLTTHMLDTMNGIPAEGVKIDFSVLEG